MCGRKASSNGITLRHFQSNQRHNDRPQGLMELERAGGPVKLHRFCCSLKDSPGKTRQICRNPRLEENALLTEVI